MENPIDIKEYKKAKFLVSELDKLIPLMEKCMIDLEPFKKFKAASETIFVLKNNKILLDIHYNKYKRILEGKTNETQES